MNSRPLQNVCSVQMDLSQKNCLRNAMNAIKANGRIVDKDAYRVKEVSMEMNYIKYRHHRAKIVMPENGQIQLLLPQS